MKQEKYFDTIQVLMAFVIVILFIFLGVSASVINKLNEQNDVIVSLLVLSVESAEALPDLERGNQYYDLAGLSYERDDWNNVEYNCKLARDNFASYTQEMRGLKFSISEKPHQIFRIYEKMFDEEIIMYENLFEACEYFESASRYYAMENYEMGGVEIDGMNEKIRGHDDAVRRYNDLLEQYSFELKKLVENGVS